MSTSSAESTRSEVNGISTTPKLGSFSPTVSDDGSLSEEGESSQSAEEDLNIDSTTSAVAASESDLKQRGSVRSRGMKSLRGLAPAPIATTTTKESDIDAPKWTFLEVDSSSALLIQGNQHRPDTQSGRVKTPNAPLMFPIVSPFYIDAIRRSEQLSPRSALGLL